MSLHLIIQRPHSETQKNPVHNSCHLLTKKDGRNIKASLLLIQKMVNHTTHNEEIAISQPSISFPVLQKSYFSLVICNHGGEAAQLITSKTRIQISNANRGSAAHRKQEINAMNQVHNMGRWRDRDSRPPRGGILTQSHCGHAMLSDHWFFLRNLKYRFSCTIC